jgi:hypothetical protein
VVLPEIEKLAGDFAPVGSVRRGSLGTGFSHGSNPPAARWLRLGAGRSFRNAAIALPIGGADMLCCLSQVRNRPTSGQGHAI